MDARGFHVYKLLSYCRQWLMQLLILLQMDRTTDYHVAKGTFQTDSSDRSKLNLIRLSNQQNILNETKILSLLFCCWRFICGSAI